MIVDWWKSLSTVVAITAKSARSGNSYRNIKLSLLYVQQITCHFMNIYNNKQNHIDTIDCILID